MDTKKKNLTTGLHRIKIEIIKNVKLKERMKMKKFVVKEPLMEPKVIDVNDVGNYIKGYIVAKADIFSEGVFMVVEEDSNFNFCIGNNKIYGTVVFVGGFIKDEINVNFRVLQEEEIKEVLVYFRKQTPYESVVYKTC